MKSLSEHIRHIHSKPHHIRKRVAFTAALTGTALIALVWLVGNLSLGTFAIQGSNFADRAGKGSVIVVDDTASVPNIAGAAAPLQRADKTPRIEIVNTPSPISIQKKAEQTIIPF